MQRLSKHFLLGLLTTIFISGLSAQHVKAKTLELSFEIINHFEESQIPEAYQEIIRSNGALSAFWERHAPKENMPDVDFRKNWIIAVGAGLKPTRGYRHCVSKAIIEDNILKVFVESTEPSENLFLPLQNSSPGCLIQVPRQVGIEVAFQNTEKKAQRTALKMRDLIHVSNSMIQEPREVLSRDLDSFKLLWKEHGAELSSLPDVDFKQEMVIAVFMGEQSTGGYDLSIHHVLDTETELQIYLERRVPPEDSMVIQMLTAPAHFVAIPARDKTVVFKEMKRS